MPAGRPRSFDVDDALDRALEVFWRHGYEGASLPDLTAAMGISRPSLYAAFGNKEELFRRALDRYAEHSSVYLREAIAEPTAEAVARKLLFGAAAAAGDPKRPRGCFLVQGALACSGEADDVRRAAAERRAAGQALLRRRFRKAAEEGDLPPDVDPADLARYVFALLHGMAVHAAGGAKRDELTRVAELAMRSWPASRAKDK